MATDFRRVDIADSPAPETVDVSPRSDGAGWRRAIAPLASLRLTVVLFVAAILIVLFGTLAQTELGIWEVVRDYFRVDFQRLFTSTFPWIHAGELFVFVKLKLFFPQSFFPTFDPAIFVVKFPWFANPVELGFAFPKGWVIGTAMMLNLVAAHLVRFKVQARGARLAVGWGIIALGAVLTWLVILSGSDMRGGLQDKPLISYDIIWMGFQATLFGLCAVSLYAAATADPEHPEQRWLFGILAALLGLATFAAFRGAVGSESTMRILYQVVKATLAGVLLLAGCIAVFKKRAGIVLIHAGVGLMMFYDVLVGTQHVESQMHLMEKETTNFTRDLRESEFAVVEHRADDDFVTVVDSDLLRRALATGQPIDDPRLPFTVSVQRFYENSTLLGPMQPLPESEPQENPATQGSGTVLRVAQMSKGRGTDSESAFDAPSAYVTLADRAGQELGTWLLSTHFDLGDRPQPVTVGDKTYDIALRFRRLYLDYTITLDDVSKEDYKGTDRPRDYSSHVRLSDPGRDQSFEHRIWMNNPMRYGGKTYYQSGYQLLSTGEMTTLQVVDNVGWMTPYVSCMMVVVGMLFHFGQTLLRFLQRRLRGGDAGDSKAALERHFGRSTSPALKKTGDRMGRLTAGALVLLVGAFLLGDAFKKPADVNGKDLAAAGNLPLWYQGRAMPLDTFARNALMKLSDRQTFKNDEGDSQPAMLWLLDLMGNEAAARGHQIVRIESDEVRAQLGLQRREGLTYSIREVMQNRTKLMEEADAAAARPADQRTLYQRKVYELARKVTFYIFLEQTMGRAPDLGGQPLTANSDRQEFEVRVQQYLGGINQVRRLNDEFSAKYGLGSLPLVVPTHLKPDETQPDALENLHEDWETPVIAHLYAAFYNEMPVDGPPALELFEKLLSSYRDGSAADFNAAVANYSAFLEKHRLDKSEEDLPLSKVAFEAWFNRFSAFNTCSWLYVFAFVLGVTGWLFLPDLFQRSAFWLIALILAVHTFAIVGRIYISGRPPVTNLYSSAVFIGWATVLGGLIIESMTRLGAGNVVAAMAGFLTLRIAHGLAADGDTFVVLEAVLDTQVWLATHVVCVTLGYATTYLAGLFGLLFITQGVFTPTLSSHLSKELSRMTYGVLCFALFFSFWGTVLGGLWADDSWGRFWGWDPKENGALIIVLWNALVLHARWAGMVKDRGLAVLAVLGNIVVSWSWFGVNELGIGLHSYGFTEGRLRMLGLYVLSQLVIAGVGCLPRSMWLSEKQLAANERAR